MVGARGRARTAETPGAACVGKEGNHEIHEIHERGNDRTTNGHQWTTNIFFHESVSLIFPYFVCFVYFVVMTVLSF